MIYKIGDRFRIYGLEYLLVSLPLAKQGEVKPTHLMPRIALFCLKDGIMWGNYIEVANPCAVTQAKMDELYEQSPNEHTKYQYEVIKSGV